MDIGPLNGGITRRIRDRRLYRRDPVLNVPQKSRRARRQKIRKTARRPARPVLWTASSHRLQSNLHLSRARPMPRIGALWCGHLGRAATPCPARMPVNGCAFPESGLHDLSGDGNSADRTLSGAGGARGRKIRNCRRKALSGNSIGKKRPVPADIIGSISNHAARAISVSLPSVFFATGFQSPYRFSRPDFESAPNVGTLCPPSAALH